jgi:hypothetical protein
MTRNTVSHNSPTPHRDPRAHRADRSAHAAVALLLISFACLGLTACSSSQSPAAAAAARSKKLYRQERAESLDLVHCAHAHGIPLPEPNAENNVRTVGINLKGRRRKAALTFCYQKAVKKAAKELEEERVREGKPAKEATTAQTSAPAATVVAQERQHLMEVVSCARRHGIHLPEPDAHNNINTRGLHLKSHRNNIVMSACFREVVGKASREQEELAREQQAGPRRLGEGPTE